jgi:hypothetical protein
MFKKKSKKEITPIVNRVLIYFDNHKGDRFERVVIIPQGFKFVVGNYSNDYILYPQGHVYREFNWIAGFTSNIRTNKIAFARTSPCIIYTIEYEYIYENTEEPNGKETA